MMEPWLGWLVLILVLLVMMVGMIGLLIPVLPGTVIIWLAALGYGLVNGFGTLGWVIFGILTLIMLTSTVIDNFVVGAKTLQGGAALSSVVLGILAGVVFTLLALPFGGLVAAPLVIYVLEYRRSGSWERARDAVKDLTVGVGLSWVVRLGMGLLMVVLWGIWALNSLP
jgi:hypothetical protein